MSIEIEIRALRATADGFEWSSAAAADTFGVYVGKPGCFCHLNDLPTLEQAESFATKLGANWRAPVVSRVGAPTTIYRPEARQSDSSAELLSAAKDLMAAPADLSAVSCARRRAAQQALAAAVLRAEASQ